MQGLAWPTLCFLLQINQYRNALKRSPLLLHVRINTRYGNDGLCVVQQICVEFSRPCLIGVGIDLYASEILFHLRPESIQRSHNSIYMYLLCYGFSQLVDIFCRLTTCTTAGSRVHLPDCCRCCNSCIAYTDNFGKRQGSSSAL